MWLIKLGGSLITNKRRQQTYQEATVRRIAQEIRAAQAQQPSLRLIIGHGSGSFGHFEAHKHGTAQGVSTREQWVGFSQVATVAAKLNQLVTETFQAEGIPALSFSPSASAIAEAGVIQTMSVMGIQRALEYGLTPITHGDVAFDNQIGGTIISTEAVFSYLALQIPVEQIILLGEVAGVHDAQGQIIPHIHDDNFTQVQDALGGSAGVDVTGGMLSKVQDMLQLARQRPGLRIRICTGQTPGLLQQTLLGLSEPGTLITS